MRLLATRDDRLSVTPTIAAMAGDSLPEFLLTHYAEDRPVEVYHARDLHLQAKQRAEAKSILVEAATPMALTAYWLAGVAGNKLLAKRFGDAVQRLIARPFPDVAAICEEDNLRSSIRRDLKRSFGIVNADATPYRVLIADYTKEKEAHGIGSPKELINSDRLAGTSHDWQMLTLGHEIGHVIHGIPEKRDYYRRIEDEGMADHYAGQFYALAASDGPVKMDADVPQHFHYLRQANLVQASPMRVHFPGGEKLADLARDEAQRQTIFDSYRAVSDSIFEDISRYIPHVVHAELDYFSRVMRAETWPHYWLMQAKEGWESLDAIGVVSTKRPPRQQRATDFNPR